MKWLTTLFSKKKAESEDTPLPVSRVKLSKLYVLRPNGLIEQVEVEEVDHYVPKNKLRRIILTITEDKAIIERDKCYYLSTAPEDVDSHPAIDTNQVVIDFGGTHDNPFVDWLCYPNAEVAIYSMDVIVNASFTRRTQINEYGYDLLNKNNFFKGLNDEQQPTIDPQ